MAQAMKSVTETGVELTSEERYLLSNTYKHVAKARRSSWRIMSSIKQKSEAFPTMLQPARELRERVEVEISKICYQILELLYKYLIPKINNPESEVFYLKMKGDFYRHSMMRLSNCMI